MRDTQRQQNRGSLNSVAGSGHLVVEYLPWNMGWKVAVSTTLVPCRGLVVLQQMSNDNGRRLSRDSIDSEQGSRGPRVAPGGSRARGDDETKESDMRTFQNCV